MSPSASYDNSTYPHQWDGEGSHQDGHISRTRRAKTHSQMAFKSTTPIKAPGHGNTYYITVTEDLRQNRKCGEALKSPPKKHKTIDLPNTKGTTDDPFAGMNTVVDYQQEIERLKVALAQTDTKSKRPRSPGSPKQDPLPANEPFVSLAEQERFLAFMRMWTGGSQRWNNCSRCF